MQHGRSWKANTSSASEEILYILWHPTLHYYVQNSPPFVPLPSQINPTPHPIFLRCTLILSSQLHLGLPSISFFQESTPKSRTNLSSSPCRPNALPISFSFVLSPEGYFVNSTNLDATHYAFFQSPITSSQTQIPSSAPYLFSNALSQYASFNVKENGLHPHKTTGQITILYLLIHVLRQWTRRQNILDRMTVGIL